MKKTTILAALIILVLSMSSCGISDSSKASDSSESSQATVEIVLPASAFEDETDFDAQSYAEEQGFTKAVKNEDGSVTVTMTVTMHEELLKSITDTIEDSFAKYIGADDTPYVKSIKHTGDFQVVTINVDKIKYEAASMDTTPFTVGLTSMMYQTYAGTAQHVEINVCDVDTGEILFAVVYPDAMQS